jgi:biopolymer transport protein ExbD
MAIHPPGQKFRNHRLLSRKGGKREVTATLSLTAMVDMFTVLVIFLLQNYNTTGEVLYIPKEVTLPKAEKIKELKPAVVVTISSKEILVDKTSVITFDALKAQQEWLIQPLLAKLTDAIQVAKQDYEKKLQNQINAVVNTARGSKDKDPADANPWNKVTIQADKGIDFLTVKKVMYTVTEAGAGEINFAVTKNVSQGAAQPPPQ